MPEVPGRTRSNAAQLLICNKEHLCGSGIVRLSENSARMPQLHAILTQPYPLGFLLTGAGTTPKRSRPMVLRLLQRRVCSTAFPPFANIRELQLALHTLVLPCRLHDTSFVACQHGPVGSGATTVTGIGGAPDAHDFIVQSLGRKTT